MNLGGRGHGSPPRPDQSRGPRTKRELGLKAQGGVPVVLPLLATRVLWVNLVSDGAPALALGVYPADDCVMRKPPRPRGEGVITRRMWAGIFFVGVVMAAGTLLVLDWSLPGGLIEGSGDMRHAHTMAFTTVYAPFLQQAFSTVGLSAGDWLRRGGVASSVL